MSSSMISNVEDLEQKHSRFGIASFILSLVAGLAMCGALVFVILLPGFDTGTQSTHLFTLVVGLVFCGFFLVDFVAIGLGIAGLFERNRKKVFAILGIVFSSATVLVLAGLFILGTVNGNS